MLHSKNTIAIPPGETIREQLADRGMLQKEFAVRMDMSEKHISNLINGEVRLAPDVALRLESVLGIPASFWNNLEANYREKLARVKDELVLERDEEIARKMPYARITKLNWVPTAKTLMEKVRNLRGFFEVSSLGLLGNLRTPGIAYRKTGENETSDYSLACWAQKAKLEARKISVEPVNMKRLEESIPEIRSLTVQSPEFFCDRLRNILTECGIALVFLPHIGGSFLHGASFPDGKRIVVGITVRGKNADKFWFSLLHELGHVIKGHVFSNDSDIKEQERSANTFAQNVLIPEEKFNRFTSRANIQRKDIVSFANEIGIASGIVLGRLQKEGCVRYDQHADLKQQYVIG